MSYLCLLSSSHSSKRTLEKQHHCQQQSLPHSVFLFSLMRTRPSNDTSQITLATVQLLWICFKTHSRVKTESKLLWPGYSLAVSHSAAATASTHSASPGIIRNISPLPAVIPAAAIANDSSTILPLLMSCLNADLGALSAESEALAAKLVSRTPIAHYTDCSSA